LEDGSTPGEDDWTSEDDEKLEALWTTAQTDELLAQFSDRSEAEIAGRAETLGLKSFFFDELREVALKAERGELVGGTGSSHRGGHYEGAAAAEDESQEKKIAPLEERKRRRRRKDGLSYPVPEGLQMPREGFENGERGNSLWTPHDGLKNKAQVEASLKSYGKKGVMFRRGFPVLQPFIYRAQGENGRKVSSRIFMEFTGNRNTDFSTANTEYAKKLGWTKKNGKPDAARVERMRIEEGLTWHHVEDCKRQKMILVPTIIHEAAHHTGGHSLCTTE
jgi:hypothetical protein